MQVAEHFFGETTGLAQWLSSLGSGRSAAQPSQGGGADLGRWRQALSAAGLSGLLHSRGQLTLLAPTDAAFESLMVEQSLRWEQLCADTARLRQLLLGHVLPFQQSSAWCMGSLKALGEAVIKVEVSGAVTVLCDANQRRARVLSTDEASANAPLRHRIDRVLLPPARPLLAQLVAQPALRAFTAALHTSGVASLLHGSGPFTVFAPDDNGFARLAARLGLRQRDLNQRPALLAQVLAGHVLPGRWLSSDLPWGGTLRTVAGGSLSLAALGLLGLGDAAQPLLPGSDLLTSNGVIHRIAHPLVHPLTNPSADPIVFPTHRKES